MSLVALVAALVAALASPSLSLCLPTCTSPPVRALLPLPASVPRAFPYYARAGASLAEPAPAANVTVGVLMLHGTARNAAEYYCYMENAVRAWFGEDGARERVRVVAPAVKIREDRPADDEIYWDGNDGWKMGSPSTVALDGARISSFAVLDLFLEAFADRARYPNLRAIVFAGHSAGGQVLQRYALGTPAHDGIVARGIEVRYFPANPSSFTYLDGERPLLGSTDCATFCTNSSMDERVFEFATPAPADSCLGTYNDYRYGLENLNEYMSQLGADAMLAAYPGRQVYYVQGLADTCNEAFGCDCDDGGLATGCESMLQGYCRLWRGYAFYQHVQRVYARRGLPGPVHTLVPVVGTGHDGCSTFQSPEVTEAMFSGL